MNFPPQQGLFSGPGQYQPTKAKKLFALNSFLKVAQHIRPKENFLLASVLWHPDLHGQNLFVHPKRPTEIVGVIDWQSTILGPLCLQARHPALVEFEGPVPEGLKPVSLPHGFNSMSPDEQTSAKRLHSAQLLYKLYEIVLHQECKDIARCFPHQKTVACRLPAMAGWLFNDGEAAFTVMLIAVEENWPKLVTAEPDGRPPPPCPLAFSDDEKAEAAKDLALWEQGLKLMEEVSEELGVPCGWDGSVGYDEYDTMKVRLAEVRECFLKRMARTETERAQWIKAWPFQGS